MRLGKGLIILGEVKYRMYPSYINSPDSNHLKHNLLGEIYECYVYFRLVEKLPSTIDIVISKIVSNQRCKGFELDDYGQLFYYSDGICLAEFDMIGYTPKIIYYWEVAKSVQNTKHKHSRVQVKKELLQRLFPNHEIKIILVTPQYIERFEEYESIIIEEPNYNELIKYDAFHYGEINRELLTLDSFANKSIKYNYIKEIIELSKKFDCPEDISEQSLIERVYDLKNIHKEAFKCYNLERKSIENIKATKKGIWKNDKKVTKSKKTYNEVKQIRKYLNLTKIYNKRH